MLLPNFFNPKSMTLQQCIPKSEIKLVCSQSPSNIGIWLQLEQASMKLNYLHPIVDSTSYSILESEKLSFGQTLFKSLKSMHILIFPFFLGTTIMFCELNMVLDFFDEANLFQSLDLLKNYVLLILTTWPSFLSNKSCSIKDIKHVTSHTWINYMHIFYLLGEYFYISS